MPLKVKLAPFERHIDIMVNARLAPKERQNRIAAFARREIADIDEVNRRALGVVPPKTVTVNGIQGAPLESANPDRGTIIAEWRLVGEVLQWIRDRLRERSPVGKYRDPHPGLYRDSHVMLADGSVSDVEDHALASEFVFVNPQPYHRKLEIGKTKSGREFLVSVPNRIYERTARDAKARFGNLGKIRFSYYSYGPLGRVPAIIVALR